MKLGSLLKKIFCLLIACAVSLLSVGVAASAESSSSANILFIGNSLTYYNEMPDMLYHLGLKSGLKLNVESVTESGTTMYRCASLETDVGKRVDAALNSKYYDYIILQPSRRISPYETTVLEAEKKAALYFNDIANQIGAQTLIFSTPGLNTNFIDVYTMNEDGINSTLTDTKPITRTEHNNFTKKIANEICSTLVNAQVVNVGDSVENAINSGFSYSLYNSDGRHPTRICSYLFASCFYDTIIGFVSGNSYVNECYPENVAYMQKIADITILNADLSTLNYNNYQRSFNWLYLTAKNKVYMEWKEKYNVLEYEIYRKPYGGSYVKIATLPSDHLSYTDTVSEPNKYYYRYRAKLKEGNLEFNSTYSPSFYAITLGSTSLKSLSLVNKTTAKLTFSSAYGAKGYKIYRKVFGGSYSHIGTTSSLSYTDKSMEVGKTYYYKIRAYTVSGGNNIYSSYTSEQNICAIEAPTVKLKSGKNSVKVSFTSSKGVTGYLIYMKQGANGKYKLARTTSDTSSTIKKLKSNKTYYFKVKAFKLVGSKSNYSKMRSSVNIKTKKAV